MANHGVEGCNKRVWVARNSARHTRQQAAPLAPAAFAVRQQTQQQNSLGGRYGWQQTTLHAEGSTSSPAEPMDKAWEGHVLEGHVGSKGEQPRPCALFCGGVWLHQGKGSNKPAKHPIRHANAWADSPPCDRICPQASLLRMSGLLFGCIPTCMRPCPQVAALPVQASHPPQPAAPPAQASQPAPSLLYPPTSPQPAPLPAQAPHPPPVRQQDEEPDQLHHAVRFNAITAQVLSRMLKAAHGRLAGAQQLAAE